MGEKETTELFSSEYQKATNGEDYESSSEKPLIIPVPLKGLEKKATAADNGAEKKSVGLVLNDRDAALARLETEKRLALIKAWEDSEKAKVDNKAYKKLSGVDAWENIRRASIEAQLKQIEEKIEQKRAKYEEKMKNKMAIIHKVAEEKRALVEADLGKEVLTVEETAAKFRATGQIPKKIMFACFTS